MDQVAQADPMASRAGPEQRLLAALPPGWRAVGRCRLGLGGPAGVGTGCLALAHPTVGVALIDLIPHATPNAEARLRRALEAAGFHDRCPGMLPVWHGRVDPMMLRTLPNVLAEGFDSLPPLGLGGPEGWIGAVQAALARDPAWDVPGRPRAAAPVSALPEEAEEEDAIPTPRQRRVRWIGGGVALACCLAVGIALLPAAPAPTVGSAPTMAAAPAPSTPPSAAVPAPSNPPTLAATPAAGSLPTVAAAPAAGSAPTLAAPAPSNAPTVAAAPAPAPVLAAMPPPTQPAPEPPVAQSLPPIERVALPVLRPVEPPPAPAAEPPPAEAAVVEEPALATPPPAPPPPPPLRQVAAPRPRIDPNCSRALFRFQQGERLTPAEEAFVKTGCVTRR